MPLVVKDRVKETTTTTSTGTYTLAGAVTGFQSFSVIGNGNTTYYAVTDGTDWEVGIGTYTSSGTTLSRDTILESSNSGNAVNWGAGVKDVFVTYPAERSMYVDGTAITPAIAARLGFANLAQGSALSVLGVTGNSTADNASIAAGSDHQVLRRSGTSVAFGAVALDQANAITGTLPVANGGTGITSFGTGVATWLGTPSSANLAAAVTDETGSGSLVFATSPTLVTPTLGAATATSINKVAFTAPATSATLTIANGKTLTANNSLTLAGTDATTMTFPSTSQTIAGLGLTQTFTAAQTFRAASAIRSEAASTQDAIVIAGRAGGSNSYAITLTPATLSASRTLTLPEPGSNETLGYINTPIISQSAAYTLVLTDAGKTILHPDSDNNARTFTIPANGSVAYPVGTVITFVNLINTVTIAITTDTMYLAGPGTTGSRTLAAYGVATAVKLTSTTWLISGNGLT